MEPGESDITIKYTLYIIWRPRTINSYKIEEITMGWACTKNGESKCTQDGDGWSDVWKTPSREAQEETDGCCDRRQLPNTELEKLGSESTGQR
jgi:hypothetical protein